jgi:glycosyltransferase involved in cell wall biosynthesis
MVLYSYYPLDARVKRECDTLLEHGINVDVICIRNDEEKRQEDHNGVSITRLPMKLERGGIFRYSFQYGLFFAMIFFLLMKRSFSRKYDVIHFHSLPDFIVFAGVIPKLFGATLILDLHEAMPEIFISKIRNEKLFTAMKHLERWSIQFADIVITVNDIIRELFIERGADGRKIRVIMNVPQKIPFIKNYHEFPENGPLTIVFSGRLNEHNNFNSLLEGMASMKGKIPIKLHIYGDGEQENEIKSNGRNLNLENDIIFHGRVPHDDVISEISKYDIAILPLVHSPITELAIPTKLWDYVAAKLPILTSDLNAIRKTMGKIVHYYNNNNDDPTSIISGVYEIIGSGKKATYNKLVVASEILNAIRWEIMGKRLIDVYKSIENHSILKGAI